MPFVIILSCGCAASLIHLLLAHFKFEEMNIELEENRELAENRLSELQKLQQDLQTVVQENNNMKVAVVHVQSHQQKRTFRTFHICKPQSCNRNLFRSLKFIFTRRTGVGIY